MFRTIVVAHDGTDRSDAAIDLALRLRHPQSGRIVLLAAVRDSEARARAMQRLSRRAAAFPPDVPHEIEVVETVTPLTSLTVVTRALDADLLVLGPSHRGAVARTAGRTTVQRILHDAPCTVAVAGAGRTLPDRPVVLVGHDGSREADAAAQLAYVVARAMTGSVRLVHVLPVVAPGLGERVFGDVSDAEARREQDAQTSLGAAAAAAPEGVQVRTRLLRGGPAHRLLEESLDADLLILGSRHRSRTRRALTGAVTTPILIRAELPVLVWGSPDEDPEVVPMRAALDGDTLTT